jgi:type IVB pilus formation R64 PilN family outer membrane protein
MMKKTAITILTFSLLWLAGCSTAAYKDYNQSIADTQSQLHDSQQNYATPTPVKTEKGIYASTNPIHEEHTPAWMKTKVALHGKNLPLSFYLSKVATKAHIDVNYADDVNANKNLSVNYSGTIQGLLQHLRAQTGYSYHLNDSHDLVWSAKVTRTFDISFMPGSTDYTVGGTAQSGQQSGSGGSGQQTQQFGSLTSANNEYSNLKGQLSIWKDLKATLNDLKSKAGKVVVSEATTTVTAYDYPHNIAMMAKYLQRLNKSLSRQVALQVKVVEVDLNKGFNYGIDWGLIRKVLDVRLGIQGNSANSVSLKSLGENSYTAGFILKGQSGGALEGSSMLINALKQQGRVSVDTEPRVVTLNNQVAEIGINKLQGYLASVSETVGGQGDLSTESLNPGVVKTGFSLYVLPKIKDNKVYLQISSDISRLNNIQNISSGSGDSSRSIQVPNVNEKLFNQRSLVSSGNTLVIAGFKQLENQTGKTEIASVPSGEGGSKVNMETIFLITPTVLG